MSTFIFLKVQSVPNFQLIDVVPKTFMVRFLLQNLPSEKKTHFIVKPIVSDCILKQRQQKKIHQPKVIRGILGIYKTKNKITTLYLFHRRRVISL